MLGRKRKEAQKAAGFELLRAAHVEDQRLIEAATLVASAALSSDEQIIEEASVVIDAGPAGATAARMAVTDRRVIWATANTLEVQSFDLRGLQSIATTGDPVGEGLYFCVITVVDRDGYDATSDEPLAIPADATKEQVESITNAALDEIEAACAEEEYLFFVTMSILRAMERIGGKIGLLASD